MTMGCTAESQKLEQAKAVLAQVPKRAFRLLWNELCKGAVDMQRHSAARGDTWWTGLHRRLAALVMAVRAARPDHTSGVHSSPWQHLRTVPGRLGRRAHLDECSQDARALLQVPIKAPQGDAIEAAPHTRHRHEEAHHAVPLGRPRVARAVCGAPAPSPPPRLTPLTHTCLPSPARLCAPSPTGSSPSLAAP